MKLVPRPAAFGRLLLLASLLAAPAFALDTAEAARAAAARGDFRSASRLYQDAASTSSGGIASDYRLLAAEALLKAGDAAGVDAVLRRIPSAMLDAQQFQRSALLRARALLVLGQPKAALQALPAAFDISYASEGLALRAAIEFSLGEVRAAVADRLRLNDLLPGEQRAAERESLWRELAKASLPQALPDGDPRVEGWIELARLARLGGSLADYEVWRKRYPAHPGEAQLAALFATAAPGAVAAGEGEVSTVSTGTGGYALLLPLSGPLASAGQAIHAGAAAARAAAGNDAPRVVAQDTQPGLATALAGAAAQGAAVIIGPLRKEEVAALAISPPSAPVLSLNYLDAARSAPAGLTAFGLSPEDEARAAAEEAAGSGRLHALILAQDSDWGTRTAAAFRAQLELRGGTVVAEARYKTGTVDYSAQLKALLLLQASEARSRALAGIGIRAEFEARPRGDVEVIYLAARAKEARLIWPQLRYFRAGHLAVYAPAAAADAGNADLGGLRVCDAPWLGEQTGAMADLRGQLAAVNPRTPDAQRLFALGYDAYTLAAQVAAGSLTPGSEIAGLSGALTLAADGAVHRRLSCPALVAPVTEIAPAEGEAAADADVVP